MSHWKHKIIKIIRMIKFGLILTGLCSIYALPLNNHQDTNIVTKSNFANLDFPILQKDKKSDWKVDIQVEFENPNLERGSQVPLKYSRFDTRLRQVQNFEIFSSTRMRKRIRRNQRRHHSTTIPPQTNIHIFIPNNRDRFDAWGG